MALYIVSAICTLGTFCYNTLFSFPKESIDGTQGWCFKKQRLSTTHALKLAAEGIVRGESKGRRVRRVRTKIWTAQIQSAASHSRAMPHSGFTTI
jgi:hypothetical protein